MSLSSSLWSHLELRTDGNLIPVRLCLFSRMIFSTSLVLAWVQWYPLFCPLPCTKKRGESCKNGTQQLFAMQMTVMLPWKNAGDFKGVCVLLGLQPSGFDLLQVGERGSCAELYPCERVRPPLGVCVGRGLFSCGRAGADTLQCEGCASGCPRNKKWHLLTCEFIQPSFVCRKAWGRQQMFGCSDFWVNKRCWFLPSY